jgi:hypothetical protein
MSVIVKLLSKFDDTGIKKAKSSFGGLKKTIGAIGIGIGIQQITDLLIDSAKAASADKKSTQLLNTQLVKNAGATKTQIKQSDKFIENLSLQTGIMDDDLRPSMGKLVRVTKDVDKAQGLLSLSLDAATVSGKPLDTVATAMAKAFAGNTTSLVKLFPELKKSKDLFGDLAETVGGVAIQQADPFMKFNNSMDILKEKLGNIILPIIETFVTEITKPGGLVDQIGKFLEDVSNPNTEVGTTFKSLTDTVQGLYDAVVSVIKLISDLFNMKSPQNGILGDLQGIFDLVKAIADTATMASDALDKVTGKEKPKGKDGKPKAEGPNIFYELFIKGVNPALQIGDLYNNLQRQYFPQMANGGIVKPTSGGTLVNVGEAGRAEAIIPLGGKNGLGNTVNVYVQSADPRAVVDAVTKYVKGNGSLPTAWGR